MPVNENPFAVLGISLDDAGQLANLDRTSRMRDLSLLKRYYASVYRSVLAGDNTNLSRLQEINAALENLEDDERFNEALTRYQSFKPPTPSTSQRASIRQAEYLRAKAESERRDAEASLGRIQQMEIQLAGLQQQVRRMTQEIFRLEGEKNTLEGVYAHFRSMYREQLEEHRKHVVDQIKALNARLLDGTILDVPEHMTSLNQVAGKTFTIETQTGKGKRKRNNVLRINGNLMVVDESDTLEYRRLATSLLLGGLQTYDKSGILTPRSKGYDKVLFNLQPYLGVGMRPVVEMGRDTRDPKSLYVHGKIIDIKPVEG